MSGLLEGHVAVITGAGSGIGRAIAMGYAEQGATVAAVDIDSDAASRTAHEIAANRGLAHAYQVDVSDHASCAQLAEAIESKTGQVSVLVNNAGINRRNPFSGDPQAVLKDWRDVLSVNLDGVFNMTHALLEPLRASRGRVINIGSIQSFMHVRTPNSPAYTTSKHGVLGLTRALAAELGKDGVRVNAIGPGLIETPLNEKTRTSNPDVVHTFMQHTPLGRTGKPEDIVGPAVFLASDLSQYVTGCMLMVDGGYRTI